MARTDLLALTDDGLVQLANAGLVKRAQREVAAGQGPVLEDLDGTITARFADGTETRLMPGQALGDARCTCPSSGVCRHRVMLVLAYRAEAAAARADAAPDETSPDAEWSPASLDLDGFEAQLRPAAKAELGRLLASSHTVRLDHGRPPSARLPMATVRFLVPDDLSYARCDCVQAQGCVHVALAIRAFRAANGADEAVVGDVAAQGSDTERLRLACTHVVERLLALGATAGTAAHVQPLVRAREEALALGAAQALLAIEALSEQIESYEARSARYDEGVVLRLAAELYARTRAADSAGALGLGEPFETEMTKSRFVSLGVRLRQEGTDVRASVLLADSDTGATAMLEKLFSPASESDRFGASLSRRQMASGVPVLGVGRGQVLTSVARRRADGLLAFGSGAGGRTQVMPREGIFVFAAPLAARSVAEVADALARRPLSLLRPRRRIDEVHIFDVEEVFGQSWSAGSQVWQAAVRLKEDGGTLHLERVFDAGAKGAIAVLTAALDGKLGALRQVTGPVRLDRGALVCEPWSLAADRFIVPDLDAVEPEGSGAVFAAEAAPALLDEVERLLSGAVHAGSRAQGGTTHKLAAGLAARLDAEGYRMLAARLRGWLAGAADAARFADAAIWLLALRESSEAGVPG